MEVTISFLQVLIMGQDTKSKNVEYWASYLYRDIVYLSQCPTL